MSGQSSHEHLEIAENSNSDTLLDLISGDEKALCKIFDLYHHDLYRHVIRYVKSPDLASDIVQDVFIKIWEQRQTINPSFSFKAFLFTVAKNHVLNILKRAAIEDTIKKEIFSFALAFHNNSEDKIIYDDLSRFAEQAIESLPPQRRLIFKMVKDEGRNYDEIATVLGISKNTVHDHITKATKVMRSLLKVHTAISLSGVAALFFC